jgi:hypothetical protein
MMTLLERQKFLKRYVRILRKMMVMIMMVMREVKIQWVEISVVCSIFEELTDIDFTILSDPKVLDGLLDGHFILVVEELHLVPGPINLFGIDYLVLGHIGRVERSMVLMKHPNWMVWPEYICFCITETDVEQTWLVEIISRYCFIGGNLFLSLCNPKHVVVIDGLCFGEVESAKAG